MAITILPGSQPPSSGFADSLSNTLGMLAQHKINKVQQRSLANGLQALGFSPEDASSVAMLPPNMQQMIVSNVLERGGLGALQQQAQPVQQPENAVQQFTQQPMQQVKAQAPAQPAALQPQARTLAQAISKPRVNPAEQHAADKETIKYYQDITRQAKAAKESDMRLDRMEELVKSGKMSGPKWTGFLKQLTRIPVGTSLFGPHATLGIDLTSLLTPETQEYDKLSTDFVKNAKDIFGARLTDTDLNTFLKTVPTSTQSDEAKIRVAENLRSFNHAALLRKEASDQIIAQNGGRRPRNLEALVEQAVGPQLDVLAEQFREGGAKKWQQVQEAQGKAARQEEWQNLDPISRRVLTFLGQAPK